jgi:hypothetical protein
MFASPEVIYEQDDMMADGTKGSGLPQRVWQPGAWLLAFSPTSCQEANFDMNQFTMANVILIPFLYLGCMMATLVAGSKAEGGALQPPESDSPPVNHRRNDLDLARILCICCVVMEHSGYANYSSHNVMVGLCWVLPFLYMTSAIAWMRSKRSLVSYSFHLLIILAVGIMANWIADIIIGRDWQSDFGNTIFQMSYVIMLLLMALVTEPLRDALRSAKGEGAKWHQLKWRFFFALFFLIVLTLWGLVGFMTQSDTTVYSRLAKEFMIKSGRSKSMIVWMENSGMTNVLDHIYVALIQVAGVLLLAHVACLFRANNLFAWILIVHIMVPRVLCPWQDAGYMHNLEFYVFGMVADAWRMKGEKGIQTGVRNYWPLVVAFLMFSALPGVVGRCDLMPPALASERWRFYGGELVFVICLVTESFQVGDPWNWLPWMTYWALYAYCFHVAWARLFPVPVGLFFTCGSAVFFPWIHAWLHPPKDDQEQSKIMKDNGPNAAPLEPSKAKSRKGWPPQ